MPALAPATPCDDFTSATALLLRDSPADHTAAYAILRVGLSAPAAHLPDDFWMLARALLDGAEDLVPEHLWRHLPFLFAHAIAHPKLRDASLVSRWLSGVTDGRRGDSSWDPASLAGLARAALLLDLPLVSAALAEATTPAAHQFQRAIASAAELPAYPRVAAALATLGDADTLRRLAPHPALAPETRQVVLLRLSLLAPQEALPHVVADARRTGQVAPDVLTALLGAADPTVRTLALLDLLPWVPSAVGPAAGPDLLLTVVPLPA